jgi:lipoprotein-anchoring transpeptidase ErfK/SrfK
VKTDYQLVLVRALSGIESPDPESRRDVYERARAAMARAPLTPDEMRHERQALEAAIRRIEAEFAAADDLSMRFAAPPEEKADAVAAAVPPPEVSATITPRRRSRMLVLAGAASLAVVIAGAIAFYVSRDSGRSATVKTAPTVDRGTASPRAEAAVDDGRSYIDRRQVVYYRSVHPAGTLVITKSQKHLYLVRPNTSAMRYTIDVGQTCSNVVGLLLVSAKEDWSARSAALAKDGAAVRTTGGQFGARALVLSDTGHRIHGSTDKQARQVIGCFPLTDDDVIDLYERVALGARVVLN